jgi:DNA gyrase subunit A
MRYTEIKLSNFSFELIDDIDKDTVDFNFNFDDSLKEPVVLPSRFPNLIINGSSGIAVGMATNIPSHNLTEVVNGVIAYMSNNEILLKDLIKHITAPDFPTGGIIYGYQGVEDSFYTGRGRLILRSKSNIETLKSGKRFIVVTEIPYMVNKSLMIERTAQLINEKKIDGILDIRDESDKTGIRIMYELKKDFSIDLVLNNLYKKTNLQIFFNVNNITLVHGKPKLLNIRNLIEYFILHRHNVIKRRVEFNLKNANKKKHILEGYLIVFNDLNRLIDIVRLNKNVSDAKSSIMKFYNLSDIQSMSILNMKLQKITNFEIKKILKDYNELKLFIKKFNNVLFFKSLRTNIIRDELLYIQKFYGDKRRTSINYANDKFKEEDVFSNEKMVITVSYKGYIKKTLLSEYRIQMRGGIGSKGVSVKKDDFTSYLFVSSNHDYLLIFTENGRLY